MRILMLSFLIMTALTASGQTAPINVCYKNDTNRTLNWGLHFPLNNGVSHTTIAPGVSIRQGGDSDGVYCISPTFYGDPRECPIDQPGTIAGFQNELQCP